MGKLTHADTGNVTIVINQFPPKSFEIQTQDVVVNYFSKEEALVLDLYDDQCEK